MLSLNKTPKYLYIKCILIAVLLTLIIFVLSTCTTADLENELAVVSREVSILKSQLSEHEDRIESLEYVTSRIQSISRRVYLNEDQEGIITDFQKIYHYLDSIIHRLNQLEHDSRSFVDKFKELDFLLVNFGNANTSYQSDFTQHHLYGPLLIDVETQVATPDLLPIDEEEDFRKHLSLYLEVFLKDYKRHTGKELPITEEQKKGFIARSGFEYSENKDCHNNKCAAANAFYDCGFDTDYIRWNYSHWKNVYLPEVRSFKGQRKYFKLTYRNFGTLLLIPS